MCGNVWCSSSGPLPAEDELHRVEEDYKLVLHYPVLDVVEVVAELPRDHFNAHQVTRAHLGPAGEPRPHLVTQVVVGDHRRERRDVFRHLRPWADEAHVAAQDVDELRDLVEAIAPEHGAQPRDAAAVVAQDGVRLARVEDAHGAELDETEEPAVKADTLLDEEDGAAALQLDAEGHHGHEG